MMQDAPLISSKIVSNLVNGLFNPLRVVVISGKVFSIEIQPLQGWD